MKEFKFEITIKESDIDGDEFWEEALETDGTGITDLTQFIIDSLDPIMVTSSRSTKEILKLISYKEV